MILRRRTERSLALTERDGHGQLRLGFAEIDNGREVWEYAVVVASLDSEILSLGQLYRDRADCENSFDELKNQWGWGGFVAQARLIRNNRRAKPLPLFGPHLTP